MPELTFCVVYFSCCGAAVKEASFGSTVANVATTAMVVIVLLTSVYMWYYYQQLLNQARYEPHCAGQFTDDTKTTPDDAKTTPAFAADAP